MFDTHVAERARWRGVSARLPGPRVWQLQPSAASFYRGIFFFVRQSGAQQPTISHPAPLAALLLGLCGLGHSPAFLCLGTELLSGKHRTHSILPPCRRNPADNGWFIRSVAFPMIGF